MNILAEKQKNMLEKEISNEEYSKREAEFLKLYYELRKKEDNKWWSKLTLEQRKSIHWLILQIYKIKNHMGGFSYEIINYKRTKTDRPIIFAVSHVGKFDIEVISEAIKDHYYLLSGDFEHLQGIIDAPFLGLNGVFYFNEKDKNDRKAVSKKMIEHLNNHGNLMYFIEGTWNLSPNLPMLPCYWGVVDIAKKGNAIIVPIAAEQYEKKFIINIGENFDMNLFGDSLEDKSLAINSLRDVLATLKWEIWESLPRLERKDITCDMWNKYISDRFSEWPYFNDEYISNLIFKPKEIISKEEGYAYKKKMIPKKENAFLFDKRNKG